jgi:hypothetical protein
MVGRAGVIGVRARVGDCKKGNAACVGWTSLVLVPAASSDRRARYVASFRSERSEQLASCKQIKGITWRRC